MTLGGAREADFRRFFEDDAGVEAGFASTGEEDPLTCGTGIATAADEEFEESCELVAVAGADASTM